MKNYFEFISDIAKERNISFKEAILNPSIKNEWKNLRKQGRKKGVQKKTKRNEVLSVPETKAENIQSEFIKPQPKENNPTIDLSRSQVIPLISNYQQTDVLNDQFNRRFYEWVNNINFEQYRGIYDISKRPNTISIYDMDKFRVHLNDSNIIIEDSPLIYNLSGYIFNGRTNFIGKRNIKMINNDLTQYSKKFPDINNTSVSTFKYDIDKLLLKHFKIYNHSESIFNFIKDKERNKPLNIVYLNDMYYSKVHTYTLIFIYGMLLTRFNNNNKKLLVSSSYNLGESIEEFYSKVDTSQYKTGSYDMNIGSTDFNFSDIVKFLSGKNVEILDENKELVDRSEIDRFSISGSNLPNTPPLISSQVSMNFTKSKDQRLNSRFKNGGVKSGKINDDRLKYKLYFKRTLLNISDIDVRSNTLKVGDFIYFTPGFISQIKSIDNQLRDPSKIKEIIAWGINLSTSSSNTTDEDFGKYLEFKIRPQNYKEIYKIDFIDPNIARVSNQFEHTNLSSIAFNPEISYSDMYKDLEIYIDKNNIDNTHNRYPFSDRLDFNKGPDEYTQGLFQPLMNLISSPRRSNTTPNTRSKEKEKIQLRILELEDKGILNEDEENELIELKEKLDKLKTGLSINVDDDDQGAGLLYGGSTIEGKLYQKDLLAWKTAFNLKGVDNKGSIGNNQNLFVFYF